MITRQRVNLQEAEFLIRKRLDFSAGANTMRGYTDGDGNYIIKSYREPIACWYRDGSVWITDEKFSQTTSRHTSIARRGLAKPLAEQLLREAEEALA